MAEGYILRSKLASRPSTPAVFHGRFTHQRPLYKSWVDDSMKKAMEAVVKNGASVREAAVRFGVPKSTLGDRISGRVQHGDVSGPLKYLSTAEENDLAKFLIKCAGIGYPKTRLEVISLVQTIIDYKGIHSTVTAGWWQRFIKRNANITLRAPSPLSNARAYATDPDIMNRYFDLLEETLLRYELKDKPCCIFNMDETGLPMDPKASKSVYRKGEKNPLACSSGNKSQTTVVACVSAAGYCMPPLVILNRKSVPSCYKEGEVPGTKYGLSPKGWIDRDLFHQWFAFHFLRYAPQKRPLLLLLDGHSSHFCPETVHLADEHDIVVFVLPPNSTHLLQPLDKGTFSPLKTYWKQECHEFMSKNPGEVVSRFTFSKILGRSWERCMRLSNVQAGFKVTGVYPFDREAAFKQINMPSGVAKSFSLPYQPMFSPAPRKKKAAAIHVDLVRYSEDDDISSEESFSDVRAVHTPVGGSFDYESAAREPGFGEHAKMPPYTSTGDTDDNSSSDTDRVTPLIYCSQTKKMLKTPIPPPRKVDPLKVKSCGKILTSSECMAIMDKKKEEKDEKERLKAERKRLQAERKQLKAENKRLLAEKRASKLLAKKSGKSVSTKVSKAQHSLCVENPPEPVFTAKELELFTTRFENGFDLTHDDRYNLWLKENGSPQNGVYIVFGILQNVL